MKTTDSSALPAWVRSRQQVAQMTLRDGDIPDFDVERCISDLKRMHVSVLTLFAGGYVAIYPSELDWQRQVPGLQGRDLFGEILAAGSKAGITVVPCIDIGEIPVALWDTHRHLVSVDADGKPFRKSSITFSSCPQGPYKRDCTRELIAELVQRYPSVDAIKFAGASYNMPGNVCHCPGCQAAWQADFSRPLPAQFKDPDYQAWRERKLAACVRDLTALAAEHGLITVGNSVWHLGRSARDIADTAAGEIVTQVEVQSRFYNVGPDDDTCWERFAAPVETCRYLDGLTANPAWVVASYFLAWPWRWSAIPAAEQQAYLAQVVANGCSPMVNFTTGAPHQHYDQRGMPAIEAVFGLAERQRHLLENDKNIARVGLVYDHSSAIWAHHTGKTYPRYLHEFHGVQEMLDQQHLPYDVIGSRELADVAADRFDVLLVPAPVAMSEASAVELQRLNQAGVGVMVTGAAGTRNAQDQVQTNRVLWDLLGIESLEPWHVVTEQEVEPGPVQPYARIVDAADPLSAGVECPVLAIAGWYHALQASADSVAVLRRMPPFRLFPEGRAEPDDDTLFEPLLTRRDHGVGRVVYGALDLGRVHMRTTHPDVRQLLVNSLAWASQNRAKPLVQGRPDLRLSLRGLPGKRLVHLINTGGRDRFRTEIEALVDVVVELSGTASRAYLAEAGQELAVIGTADGVQITVPRLGINDILVVKD
jgi:type 1 glutamine amidotransferase